MSVVAVPSPVVASPKTMPVTPAAPKPPEKPEDRYKDDYVIPAMLTALSCPSQPFP